MRKEVLDDAVALLGSCIKLIEIEQKNIAAIITDTVIERDFHNADSALKELRHTLEKEIL